MDHTKLGNILDAAGDGDLLQLVNLLQGDASLVHSHDMHGRTPLHYAAIYGHADAASHLLAHGADIEARDKWGGTPLFRAVREEILVYDRIPVMETLISAGADVNARDDLGTSPLHYAAGFDERSVIGLLLANGADVNACDKAGNTPLHDAVCYPGSEKVGLLLAWPGINVRVENKDGLTPQQFAEANRRPELALLLHRADFSLM